jgi:hypothetical protein
LIELLNEAQSIRRDKRFNLDSVWYDRLKPRMCDLVGCGAAGEGIITSSEAYDTAYTKLYNALRGKA